MKIRQSDRTHSPYVIALRSQLGRLALTYPIAAGRDRLNGGANRLMRVIPRLGYCLTEFAYLAAASKAIRAGNLVFPYKPDGYLLGPYRITTTPEPNSN